MLPPPLARCRRVWHGAAMDRDESTNRAAWDRSSDTYQGRHGAALDAAPEAWGVWRILEAELRVLGDVAGRRVLELGCGAAQWSVALARRGADAMGLDQSAQQLGHAQRSPDVGRVPLVQATASTTPFRDQAFDIVFCDHGAMSFADPFVTVPEVARLLRPGGRFVFCITSPLAILCTDPEADRLEDRLHSDWFGMRRFEWPTDPTVEFQLSYGDWLRLFRANGLEVEDLIHVRPPEDAASTYRDVRDRAWARRWPLEDLWRLRRR